MTQQTLFKVRDKRSKGWFWMDNDYLNGYAKHFGAVGTAIYLDLCRHCDNDQKCFPAQKTIAEELKIGERTVRNYIKLFERCHLIEITKERTSGGKWLNNTYWLLDKSEWTQPEATVADGKAKGKRIPSQRQLATQPEATDNSLSIPIKKNTNKKTAVFNNLPNEPTGDNLPIKQTKEDRQRLAKLAEMKSFLKEKLSANNL